MADRLEILIQAVDKASAELRNIRNGLGEMGEASAKANNQFATGSDSSLASLGRLAAGFFTAQAAFSALSRTFRAGLEDIAQREAAEIKLAVALRNTGHGSIEALNASRALADEMARASGVSDDLNLSVQAILASYGKLSGGTLLRATKAVFDLSQMQGDATSNAFALAKAASGVSDSVSKLGLEMAETGTQAERFDGLLKNIEHDFGGLTAAVGQSVEGSLARLTESFESIAGSLTKITFEKVANAFSVVNLSFEQWANVYADAAGELAAFVDGPASKLPETLVTGTKALTGMRETTEKAVVHFKELGATVQTLGQHLTAISGTSIPDFAAQAHDLSAALQETSHLMATDTERAAELAAAYRLLAEQAEALEEKGIDVPFFDVDLIEEVIEKTKELTETQDLLAGSVANLGGDFVRMGVMGELSFENAGKALRAFIADLAAAIARMLILRAIIGIATSGSSEAVAFAGWAGTASGGRLGGGGFNILPSAPGLGAPMVGGTVSFPTQFLGVSDRFIRDFNEQNARLARQYGVQIVNSEALS